MAQPGDWGALAAGDHAEVRLLSPRSEPDEVRQATDVPEKDIADKLETSRPSPSFVPVPVVRPRRSSFDDEERPVRPRHSSPSFVPRHSRHCPRHSVRYRPVRHRRPLATLCRGDRRSVRLRPLPGPQVRKVVRQKRRPQRPPLLLPQLPDAGVAGPQSNCIAPRTGNVPSVPVIRPHRPIERRRNQSYAGASVCPRHPPRNPINENPPVPLKTRLSGWGPAPPAGMEPQ